MFDKEIASFSFQISPLLLIISELGQLLTKHQAHATLKGELFLKQLITLSIHSMNVAIIPAE